METLEGMDTHDLWTMQRDAENLADKIEGVLGARREAPEPHYPKDAMRSDEEKETESD